MQVTWSHIFQLAAMQAALMSRRQWADAGQIDSEMSRDDMPQPGLHHTRIRKQSHKCENVAERWHNMASYDLRSARWGQSGSGKNVFWSEVWLRPGERRRGGEGATNDPGEWEPTSEEIWFNATRCRWIGKNWVISILKLCYVLWTKYLNKCKRSLKIRHFVF